jgi:hypothetical protein
MEFILAEGKPYFLIKMCDRFEEARTRFNFGPSVSFFPWLLSAKGGGSTMPEGLGEAIVLRFMAISYGKADNGNHQDTDAIQRSVTIHNENDVGSRHGVGISPLSGGGGGVNSSAKVDIRKSSVSGSEGGGGGDLVSVKESDGVRSDREALDEFFLATGGEGWKYNNGWMMNPLNSSLSLLVSSTQLSNDESDALQQPPLDLSSRYGVTVDSVTKRVIGLNFGGVKGLTGNNLVGEIPDCISRLTELEDLLLGSNRLRGKLPSQAINHLTKLKSLSFFNNRLTGHLEEGIFGTLTNLKYLSFSGNRLSGNIPVSLIRLSNLNQIWLDGNKDLVLPEGVRDTYFGIPCAVDFSSYRKSLKQTQHRAAVDISNG